MRDLLASRPPGLDAVLASTTDGATPVGPDVEAPPQRVDTPSVAVTAAQHTALKERVDTAQQHTATLHKAVVQLQAHVQRNGSAARGAARSAQAVQKALRAVRTDVDSVQRQVGELQRTAEARHTAVQQQLRTVARMMAVVYPELITTAGATDDFTRHVAQEMHALAEQECSDVDE